MVLDILDNSAGEFEDTEEVYEAVGEVLQGISEKSEDDIRWLGNFKAIILKLMKEDHLSFSINLRKAIYNVNNILFIIGIYVNNYYICCNLIKQIIVMDLEKF